MMHTLARRVARRKGQPVAPFEWRAPASSCKVAGLGGAEVPRWGTEPAVPLSVHPE